MSVTPPALGHEPGGPYVQILREDWAALAKEQHVSIDADTLARLRGLGDPTSMADVEEVYVPLCQLIDLYYEHTGRLYEASNVFLHERARRTPFVIGIAGSVAVGKSTVSRLVQNLLAANGRQVDLITTDGFLYPNAVLTARGIMDRKGFPESYDRRALQRFVMQVKSGEAATAPVYSHQVYDITEETITVDRPDILIVEGLNVLQPSRRMANGRSALALDDFFDFSIYVDARLEYIKQWYLERFMDLRATAFQDPTSFFRHYAELTDEEALATASTVWDTINGPNLVENIRPTRGRATAILRKGENHRVTGVRIRKI